MSKRLQSIAGLCALALLSACSGSSSSPGTASIIGGAGDGGAGTAPSTAVLLPQLEIGGGVSYSIRSGVFAANLAGPSRQLAEASLITPAAALSPSALAIQALRATGDGFPGDSRLPPISQLDPAQALGRSENNHQQPVAGALLINSLVNQKLPTGKWYKGLLYQSPADLSAGFGQNGPAPDLYNATVFPNTLALDDRLGMVGITYARERYVDVGAGTDLPLYDLSNPYFRDATLYSLRADARQDMGMAYVDDGVGILARRIDRVDELTMATSWSTDEGSQAMQLIAAQGSPYVTVRYAGLRPLLRFGSGIQARTLRDTQNQAVPGSQQPLLWESNNQLVAVGVDNEDMQSFSEFGLPQDRRTPALAGSTFHFVVRIPDRALSPPAGNVNPAPATPAASLRHMVVYASHPLLLLWNSATRSYVASEVFDGVLRSALVGAVPQAGSNGEIDPVTVPGLNDLPARSAILSRYAATFPVFGEVLVRSDEAATALVNYRWGTQRFDGGLPASADLLMMGFEATQLASLVAPVRGSQEPQASGTALAALLYPSNFGRMAAVAGSAWTQRLPLPAILQAGASMRQLWYGSRPVDPANTALQRTLREDSDDIRNFQQTCNRDLNLCGKQFQNIARLILIADETGRSQERGLLLAYLKQQLAPWLDGIDARDPAYAQAADRNSFVFDRSNGGTVTQRSLNQGASADGRNGAYVDHAGSYGYFLYAAAVLARLDAGWLAQYRDKVDTLARDIANPSVDDGSYPVQRSFDWFRMQTIADAGPRADGGLTEYPAEAINAHYALSLWFAVTGRTQLQSLAGVMAAAEIRTAQAYSQVTPENSVFKGLAMPTILIRIPAVPETAPSPAAGYSGRPETEVVMGQLAQNASATVPSQLRLRSRRIASQFMPFTPITEFVISRNWANVHRDFLAAAERIDQFYFDAALRAPPRSTSRCALAADAAAGAGSGVGGGAGLTSDPALACATTLRELWAWRGLIASLNGLNDPAGALARHEDLARGAAATEAVYRTTTAMGVDGELMQDGVALQLRRTSVVASTDTNVLWWLLARQP